MLKFDPKLPLTAEGDADCLSNMFWLRSENASMNLSEKESTKSSQSIFSLSKKLHQKVNQNHQGINWEVLMYYLPTISM